MTSTMHIGLSMECDYRYGLSQTEAFDEAFFTAKLAEEQGFTGVWLAERHFATPERTAGVPSIVSAPLILATAIAGQTTHLRIGIGVLVLPLGHPIRMAEEVATLDNISHGRLDLGVGRSGFTRVYEGYDVPYDESRQRFLEYLNVMRLAWSQDQFSYEGDVYSFKEVCVIPKTFQKPYPPLWSAATTRGSFPLYGEMGLNILVGLRGMTVPVLAEAIQEYRQAWEDMGHPGTGQVILRIPIYVADTKEKALAEPEASSMHAYARLQRAFTGTAGKESATAGEERAERSQSLSAITYDDLLRDRFAFGEPDVVTSRLQQLRDDLQLEGFIMESNVGGKIDHTLVHKSIKMFANDVVPNLH